MNSSKIYIGVIAGALLLTTSCNDWLNQQPIDAVTPNNFLLTDADLESYSIKQYSFSTHSGAGVGIWGNDNGSDNQTGSSYNTQWLPGEWRVRDSYSNDSDDPWYFGNLYNLNYFLQTVVPRNEQGMYGDSGKHCIGEIYFLRALYYFNKLKTFGDFPIIETVLPDDKETLIAASVRQPRHKVARFILKDLDAAIGLLLDSPNGGTNRITKNAAYLLKSRVALYEASWEQYHANTARVPNGPGWPGEQCDYNADEEISFFLEQCLEAAAYVADNVPLSANNHDVDADGAAKMDNPYFAQFGADDMSKYPEILLWRDYDVSLGLQHSTTFYLRVGGNTGFTRQFLETFVMKNGLPIYAENSGYQGDGSIDKVRQDRDERLQIFMMRPGETLTEGQTDFEDVLSVLPNITDLTERRAVTGYMLRKGMSNNWSRDWNNSAEGCPIFRAAEAYLNYIEASCLKNKGESIDDKAIEYWNEIRSRAGLPAYTVTVDATDLSKENDWAVYSGNDQVSALMYNIRRERRCELMEEGFRMDDLKRWRSLDRLDGTWQPEGIKLWNADIDYVTAYADEGVTLVYDGSENATVSSSAWGDYLKPYQIINNAANLMWGKGYSWCDAHYLSPISVKHFRDASETGDPAQSVIYQNPGWPVVADMGPTEI